MARLRACVTGGSRGIGRAVAAALQASGHEVTVLGRDRAALDVVVAQGDAAAAVALDILDGERLRGFLAEGGFDILVNNAGGADTGPFLKTDREAFRRMFALNSRPRSRRAAPPFRHGREEIRAHRHIASTAGLKGYAYVSAYVAAKHALVGLTRALAVEFARSGVTVNAICPGYTDTDLVAAGWRQS